jgi:hypothetical protein
MFEHLKPSTASGEIHNISCETDPIASLLEMFVEMVQAGRIEKGQCPALRPVFLKPHGVARGILRIRHDLPDELKVGLFVGDEYPAWIRFSSDTLPTLKDYKTTVGVAIKLFDVPGAKIFGPSADTFDFIFQNFDVFFVDTAAEMCAFTKAGVVDGDYGPYLAAHPKTAKLLAEMATPVASTLSTAYWSGIPFAFGRDRYVKYKLEPAIEADPMTDPPTDPNYLAVDLERRLKAGEARFRFFLQFRTDAIAMPLDQATVRWDELASPPLHVADLIIPQQDITVRGQPAYGENLSWNIWRVTEDHRPEGSIAEARKVVYEAAAELRRDVNGIPNGEPAKPKPILSPAPCVDDVVVKAAIHPGIGIARIGDSKEEYYNGPEVIDEPPRSPGFYRDSAGALKRGAARFRIYGYNAAGQVVRELTSENADIKWKVHLANKKAQWYQFQAALDIPEASTMSVSRRNPDVVLANRGTLAIDPGPRSISGRSVSGGKQHLFDTGTFKSTPVLLGELQTDDIGRLIVLGGTGKSASPSRAPIYNPSDASSFNNANDWYDDTSDGPVTATAIIGGESIPVDPAWVVIAPPNYAPNVVGWRTLFDLLVDLYVECGWMQLPEKVSFSNDILPFLRRLSNLQWVNKGFATLFGRGCPMDFDDDRFICKLAQAPDPIDKSDPYAELRQMIFNSFRPDDITVNDPRAWPWIYGDAFYGSLSATSPRANLALPHVQMVLLKRWVDGDFTNDWASGTLPLSSIEAIALGDQPSMLDRAALHFCLADAFHPGCEMTWPMRHATMYERPFRIRHRLHGQTEPDYGSKLSQRIALQPGGPLYAQGPGDLTRWMALPWQGDTAFCRSGYEPEYDPYLPTFWPARVPNWVLTDEDYQLVMDTNLAREKRIAAFNNRANWIRSLTGSIQEIMMQMITQFGAMGVVEARPGLKDDPDFPEVIFVESLAGSRLRKTALQAARLAAAPPRPLAPAERAGWESQEQLDEVRRIRFRNR